MSSPHIITRLHITLPSQLFLIKVQLPILARVNYRSKRLPRIFPVLILHRHSARIVLFLLVGLILTTCECDEHVLLNGRGEDTEEGVVDVFAYMNVRRAGYDDGV